MPMCPNFLAGGRQGDSNATAGSDANELDDMPSDTKQEV